MTLTRSTFTAAAITVAAVLVSGCGAADPATEVRDRPLDDRLVEVEARRLCALQTTAFTDPTDRESFTDTLLAEVDVTREQWEQFRDELSGDPERAAEVSDLFDQLCE